MASENSDRTVPHELDERSRAILTFEANWGAPPGQKEDAIRQTFDISPARYYQLLGRLIDSHAALAYDPLLVKRLQRLRDERRRSREERLSGEGEKN